MKTIVGTQSLSGDGDQHSDNIVNESECGSKTSSQSRNPVAEWSMTILLLLFGTTAVCQAFVIPTGSMEDTLRVGDHLLVDKLAFAPAGKIGKFLLPYQEPKHGDIIVFRYSPDLSQTLVKRLIGMPADRIRITRAAGL